MSGMGICGWLIVGALGMAACNTATGDGNPDMNRDQAGDLDLAASAGGDMAVVANPDGRPVISVFKANPTTIAPGTESNLTWMISGANEVDIEPELGALSGSGNSTVFPTTTTTYVVKATNTKGTATAMVTVTVTGTPAGSFAQTSTSLQYARQELTVAPFGSGRVLVAGGFAPTFAYYNTAEIFDAAANSGAGAFAGGVRLNFSRTAMSVSPLADGKVLIAGGKDGFGLVDYAEVLDPAGNGGDGSAAMINTMPYPQSTSTATLLANGKVLIAGGLGNTALSAAYLFDPVTNKFSATGKMSVPRVHATATLLQSGKVLIAGGEDSTVGQDSAEIFDPAGNGGVGSFSATGKMKTSRYGAIAVLLNSGKVFIMGGDSEINGARFCRGELFDPAGNGGIGTFTEVQEYRQNRRFAIASLLTGGKVLIAGGADQNGNPRSTAEIFDPAGNGGLGSYLPAANLKTARMQAAAALLSNGKVFVVGGLGATGPLKSAELFTYP